MGGEGIENWAGPVMGLMGLMGLMGGLGRARID